MSSGGLKIVSEANLGRLLTNNSRRLGGEEKYKEVLVCVDHSLTPTTPATTVRQDDSNSMEHILSDSTNIFRGGSSQHQQQEQRTFYNMDSKSWQGGFATVVSPPAEEVRREQSPVFVAAETTPSPPAVGGRSRGGGRRPTIKVFIKGFSILM